MIMNAIQVHKIWLNFVHKKYLGIQMPFYSALKEIKFFMKIIINNS